MLPYTPRDSHAYIPPSVQKAMDKHMERAMPAHLKKYQDGRAFIPQHAQDAITQHMQKTVPAHMKQYVDPYVHQHVVFPDTAPVAGASPSLPAPVPYAPTPRMPRQDNFQPPNQQSWAPPTTLSSEPPAQQQPTYDFIMNAGQQTRQSKLPKLPGSSNSVVARIALVAGGLVLLFIAFTVVRGILTSGSSNKPLLISVAQNQQQLIQSATNASLEKTISLHNKNFAITAELSLRSSQSELIQYLGKIGVKKVSPKLLNEKVSPKTAQELTAAAAADNYNPTFQTIMKTQLQQYQLALQAAYKKTAGPAGQKLLNDQYKQSELLVEQLNNTAN